MVDVITAYRLVNASVLKVADETVRLDVLQVDDRPSYVRLDESVYSVAETQRRLDNTVVVAHELSQYVNRFYSINMTGSETVWINYLIGHKVEDIDLTEFGEYS